MSFGIDLSNCTLSPKGLPSVTPIEFGLKQITGGPLDLTTLKGIPSVSKYYEKPDSSSLLLQLYRLVQHLLHDRDV